MPEPLDRATSSLFGLAAGDALGLPAEFHRSVGNPWLRGTLWSASASLDEQRVSRPLLPFSPTLDDVSDRIGTDDTETAALAGLVLLATDRRDALGLFAAWRELAAEGWHGIAVRNALVNTSLGLEPPTTGLDSPVRSEDSAVAAAVPIGIAYHGDPLEAARVAGEYACITHAEDGLWAAQLMAAVIARLIDGTGLERAIAESIPLVPSDSWLARNLGIAMDIARSAPSGFAALPQLLAVLSPRDYSHPTVAPQTLPLALAIARLESGRIQTALPLALLAARSSDSVPAMVGALCGAAGSGIEVAWMPGLDTVRGILVPATAGTSLSDLAARLLGANAD